MSPLTGPNTADARDHNGIIYDRFDGRDHNGIIYDRVDGRDHTGIIYDRFDARDHNGITYDRFDGLRSFFFDMPQSREVTEEIISYLQCF